MSCPKLGSLGQAVPEISPVEVGTRKSLIQMMKANWHFCHQTTVVPKRMRVASRNLAWRCTLTPGTSVPSCRRIGKGVWDSKVFECCQVQWKHRGWICKPAFIQQWFITIERELTVVSVTSGRESIKERRHSQGESKSTDWLLSTDTEGF